MNASAVVFISLLLLAVAALMLLGVRLALSAREISPDLEESPETEPTSVRRVLVVTALVVLLVGSVSTGIIAGCSAMMRAGHLAQERFGCQMNLQPVQAALDAYHNQYDAYPRSMRDMAAAAAAAASAPGTTGGPPATFPVGAVGWGISWPLPSSCPVEPSVRYLYVGGTDVRRGGLKVLVLEEQATHGGQGWIITGGRRSGFVGMELVSSEELDRLLAQWREQAPPSEDGSW